MVWTGAILGVLFRIFWSTRRAGCTPRSTSAWAGPRVFFLPGFVDGVVGARPGSAIAALVLVAVGGLLYTLGGVVYGFQRPDPWPRWFGFHEVFHTFTILAFVTPLRRRLAGDVLAALTVRMRASGTSPGTCVRSARSSSLDRGSSPGARPAHDCHARRSTALSLPTARAGGDVAVDGAALSTADGVSTLAPIAPRAGGASAGRAGIVCGRRPSAHVSVTASRHVRLAAGPSGATRRVRLSRSRGLDPSVSAPALAPTPADHAALGWTRLRTPRIRRAPAIAASTMVAGRGGSARRRRGSPG